MARWNRQPPTPEQVHATHAQNGDVDLTVAVDVDGIGAGHGVQVRDRVGERGEPEGAARAAVVAIQGRRVGATRNVEVGEAVVVAVQDGHATPGVEGGPSVIGVIEAQVAVSSTKTGAPSSACPAPSPPSGPASRYAQADGGQAHHEAASHDPPRRRRV